MTVFTLDKASLHYGDRRILNNISLGIQPGEHVALLGPSGAGKTSLLNLLYDTAPERHALCPQGHALIDIFSAYHNMYMGQLEQHNALYNLWNLILPIASHKQALAQLAEELGIGNKLFDSVDQLSGGQRQRVAIGRALYRQQAIFLGDEPVSSLDPVQGQQLLELIVSRHETSVVALHNRRHALSVFDRIIGIKHGEIVLDAPSTTLDTKQLDQLYVD